MKFLKHLFSPGPRGAKAYITFNSAGAYVVRDSRDGSEHIFTDPWSLEDWVAVNDVEPVYDYERE